MLTVLADQNTRQQPGTDIAAFDGFWWKRRLNDNVTPVACQLRSYCFDNFKNRINDLQLLRDHFPPSSSVHHYRLDRLFPLEEDAKKFVEYMGGADAILQKAKQDYDQGNYRWVTQVASKVVFADPNNQAARNLEADAREQLGYQTESDPWRNFYLTGAQELRNGVVKGPNTTSPNTVRAMTPEIFFDYLAVHINAQKAADEKMVLKFDFGDDESSWKTAY